MNAIHTPPRRFYGQPFPAQPGVAAPAPAVSSAYPPQTASTPLNTIGVLVLSVYILMRLGVLHEYLITRFGVYSHYSYVLVPVLFILAIVTGTLLRALSHPIGIWLTAFLCWMAASVPGSTWRRGSLDVLISYAENNFVLLFAGAMIASAVHYRRILIAMAFVPLCFMLNASAVGSTASGRLQLKYGTYDNPNDIALHLLVVAPAAAFLILEAKRSVLLFCVGIASIFAAGVLFFRTGSRGGLLTLGVMLISGWLRLPASKKPLVLALMLAAVPAGALLVPHDAALRYRTMISDEQGPESALVERAVSSSAQRKFTFWQSIAVTLQEPLLGVGAGQYSVFTAGEAKSRGARAAWLGTHNAYTQISSEMGLPGLAFHLAVIASAWRALARFRKSIRGNPELATLDKMAVCLMLSWTAYCVASSFAQVAYTVYVPLLAGLTIALASMGKHAPTASAGANGLRS